jgi:hypothetical protein
LRLSSLVAAPPLHERAGAHVAEGDTNSESDADFEFEDENLVPAAAVPAAVTPAANAATDVVDEDDQFVVDESENVLVNAEGMPLKRSMWLAQQAANQPRELELVETLEASDRAAMLERLNPSALTVAETSRQVAEMVSAGERETSRAKKSKKAAAPKKTAAPKKRSPSPVAESDNQLELEAALQGSFDEEHTEEETATAAAHEQQLQKAGELKVMLAQVVTKDELEGLLCVYEQACIHYADKRDGPIQEAYAEVTRFKAYWPEREESEDKSFW